MVKVKIFLGNKMVREHEFSAEKKFITIGRRPNHDIHLDNLAVSGDHARITISSGVILEDLKSTNGTLLNNEPISRPTPLNPGDAIQIAKFSLQVFDQRTAFPSDKEVTTWLAPTQLKRDAEGESPLQKTGCFSYGELMPRQDEKS